MSKHGAGEKTHRGHNEGSYYQTADGQWRGAITVRQDDGTVKRVYLRGATKREVMKKAAELRDRLRDGLTPTDGRELLRDFLSRWLEDAARPSVKHRTYETYKLQVRKLTELLGGVQLDNLTAQQIQRAYAMQLNHGTAPASIHLLHAVLHRALKQAKRWKLTRANVAEDVDLPRVPRKEHRTLSAEQVRQVLDRAEDDGDRLTALWTLLGFSGLRLGEALGVRWQDVDLDAGRLMLRVQLQQRRDTKEFILQELKTGGGRPIVLAPRTIAALRTQRIRQAEERLRCELEWPESDLVFRDELGGPYQQITVYRRWVVLLKRTGLPHVRPHDLRHGAASLLLAEGVHPRVVQEMLGHHSAVMTMDVYSHVQPALHQEAADRMEALLGRRRAP